MLILKNPIVLQTISTPNTYFDILGEKIIGNYQMLGTSIDSEELLHMTMQEPAVYVNMADTGPFMVENHIHADNQVKLELVNQLINRIMLYGSPHFTYQDEVFVVGVLQKLGITDVNTFMQQIKLHMDKNELLTELINHYFTNGKTIAYIVKELVQDTMEENQDLQILKQENKKDYYLHNEIYKNLMTAECNNIIYNYRNQIRNSTTAVESIQDIEWIEQADSIQLSQMRENMFFQTNPVTWQTSLYYESEPLKPEELAEKKIIERIGVAALENIIEKVSYEEQQHFHNRYLWKDYTGIFYQGANGVLERFRYYQNDKVTDTKLENIYTEQMEELTKDEIRLTKLLNFADVYAETLENDTFYQDMQRNIAISIIENQNLQMQLEKERKITERALQQTTSPDIYFEENAEYIQESRMIMQAYQLLRKIYNNQPTDIHQKNLFADQSIMVQESESTLHNAMVEEKHFSYDNKIEETINRNIIETDTKNIQNKENNIHNQQDNYLQTFFERYADIEYTSNTPLMENVELLEQINRHNVYMKELLDSKKDSEDTQEKRVVVNRSQAMRNALRALDDPQAVINEIYENGIAIERSIPKEIERILSITDENTRYYYERMMGYHDTQIMQQEMQELFLPIEKQKIISDTLKVQAGSTWSKEKNEEILYNLEQGEKEHQIIVENIYNQLQKTKQRKDTSLIQYELLNNSIENVLALEHLQTMDNHTTETVWEHQKEVQLIHKSEEHMYEDIVDEVMETLESRTLHKTSTSENMEEVQITEKQLKTLKQELITQSEEHIVQLVNQNLKTQVHSISDMVYLELERRLKNEQRRRGY